MSAAQDIEKPASAVFHICGRDYTEEDAYRRLNELKVAVDRIPLDAPLRPYFDFLLGYIEALLEMKW